MSSENTLSQMYENLRQSQAELLQVINGIDRKVLYQPHGEENWSLAVMLAHLTEARLFFTRQGENLVKNPGGTVGRTLDNEQRAEAIINAQQTQISFEQLKKQLLDSHEAMMRLLNGLSDEHLQIGCNHVRFGAMTLAEFIQRSLVEHDQAHVQQAQTFLQSDLSAQ